METDGRKKRKLDLVKCDRCRKDKQKCLPTARTWPDQRCNRCTEKDLPCSAGSRVERRKTKSNPQYSLQIASGPPTHNLEARNSGRNSAEVTVETSVDEAQRALQALRAFVQQRPQNHTTARTVSSTNTLDVAPPDHDIIRINYESSPGDQLGLRTLPSANVDLDGSTEQNSPKLTDEAFLLSYYSMMKLAMHRLQSLKSETLKVFGFDEKPGIDLRFENTRYKSFEEFVKELRIVALDRVSSALVNGANYAPKVGLSLFAGQLSSESLQDNYRTCSICDATHEHEKVLDALTSVDDVGSEFLLRQQRLLGHYQMIGRSDYRRCNGSAVQKEWTRFMHLYHDIRSRASACLQSTPFQIPHFSQYMQSVHYPPIFYSDLIGLQGTGFDLLGAADALGRTKLHQYLDSPLVHVARHMEFESRLLARAATYGYADIPDILGRFPVHIACQKSDLRIVRSVLSTSHVREKTVFGHTALHYAAAADSLDVCKMIIADANVDVNATDRFGNTALFYAVKGKKLAMIDLILSHDHIRPDTSTFPKGGATPFAQAVYDGSIPIIQSLLDCGMDTIDINQRTQLSSVGSRPLHHAVRQRNLDLVRLLCQHPNLSADEKDDFGATSLSLAVRTGFLEAVECLVSRSDVDVNAKFNDVEETPLAIAAVRGHFEIAQALLENSATDVNAQDKHSRTALEKAIAHGRSRIVELLLKDPRLAF